MGVDFCPSEEIFSSLIVLICLSIGTDPENLKFQFVE